MYQNVLVPLAPDHGAVSSEALGIARAMLKEGGRIKILTVIEAIPSYVAQYLPQDQEDRNRREIEGGLAEEFKDAADVAVKAAVGHAAQTILDEAESGGHDCIVIASHRPGLQDYFLGSTAARVVRHARCSVHVLR